MRFRTIFEGFFFLRRVLAVWDIFCLTFKGTYQWLFWKCLTFKFSALLFPLIVPLRILPWFGFEIFCLIFKGSYQWLFWKCLTFKFSALLFHWRYGWEFYLDLGLRFFALHLKEVINDFFENALLLNFLSYFFIDHTVGNFALIWVWDFLPYI